jgi:glycosyltransferase involved in cell wall biosynthesis
MSASLSVLILTQNQATRLPRLLGCASTFADEVILVDGGSTDGTAEVATHFPKVRLASRPFDGNFAMQRNYALDQARGDWVFFLDTDELPGPNLVHLLPCLLQSRFTCFKIPRYWLVREDPAEYIESDLHYPDRQLRLFRRAPEFRYDVAQSVHETIPKSARGALFPLNYAHLLHYQFLWEDRKAREAKVKRYEELRPGVMRTNRMYLYEDTPHVVKPCRESWRGTQPVSHPGDLLRERIRMFLPRL